jgi:hypothetical protein
MYVSMCRPYGAVSIVSAAATELTPLRGFRADLFRWHSPRSAFPPIGQSCAVRNYGCVQWAESGRIAGSRRPPCRCEALGARRLGTAGRIACRGNLQPDRRQVRSCRAEVDRVAGSRRRRGRAENQDGLITAMAPAPEGRQFCSQRPTQNQSPVGATHGSVIYRPRLLVVARHSGHVG